MSLLTRDGSRGALTRVLFLAYYFPPLGGGPVQRAQKFVQFLPAEGFLPIVVTAPLLKPEEYVSGIDPTLMTPIPPQVPVVRVDGVPPGLGGKLHRRLVRWLARPTLFSKWWVPAAVEAGCRAGADAQLIFATMDPFESALAAEGISRRLGVPWVADLRDPWALDEMQRYPTLLHRGMEMRRMERALSGAAAIIMNTPEAASALRKAFPRLRSKEIVSITNGFDAEDFSGPIPDSRRTTFRIVHSGALWTGPALHLRRRRIIRLLGGVKPGFDLSTRTHVFLLKAVERWCLQRPEVRQRLEIVFAGKVTPEDREIAAQSTVADRIEFRDYLPHLESVELIRTADLLFLPMHNLPPGERATVVPGKAYEYMAAGRPILAAVPDGDAHDFLSRGGTALPCRPDDVDGMIRVLDRVYRAWERGVTVVAPDAAFVRRFERRALTRELAALFRRVLEMHASAKGVPEPGVALP